MKPSTPSESNFRAVIASLAIPKQPTQSKYPIKQIIKQKHSGSAKLIQNPQQIQNNHLTSTSSKHHYFDQKPISSYFSIKSSSFQPRQVTLVIRDLQQKVQQLQGPKTDRTQKSNKASPSRIGPLPPGESIQKLRQIWNSSPVQSTAQPDMLYMSAIQRNEY